MTNDYGLDARYFKEKLGQLVRDVGRYTPEEMALALVRLSDVAFSQRAKGKGNNDMGGMTQNEN